jgi:hypothetical protein
MDLAVYLLIVTIKQHVKDVPAATKNFREASSSMHSMSYQRNF